MVFKEKRAPSAGTTHRANAMSNLFLDSVLPLFPRSLPDETLYSRFLRYHSLYGMGAAVDNYLRLFGTAPSHHDVTLSQIRTLVEKLPGERDEAVSSMLRWNTFAPYLAEQSKNDPLGEFACALCCPVCIQLDGEEYGCAYFHRAHQLPSVFVCWKHSVELVTCCPACSKPYHSVGADEHRALCSCECGYDALRNANRSARASSNATARARLAHERLIDCTLGCTDFQLLQFAEILELPNEMRRREMLQLNMAEQLKSGISCLTIAVRARNVIMGASEQKWGACDVLSPRL